MLTQQLHIHAMHAFNASRVVPGSSRVGGHDDVGDETTDGNDGTEKLLLLSGALAMHDVVDCLQLQCVEAEVLAFLDLRPPALSPAKAVDECGRIEELTLGLSSGL